MSASSLRRMVGSLWRKVVDSVTYSERNVPPCVDNGDLTWLALTFSEWPSNHGYVDVYSWGPDMRTIAAPMYHPPLIRFFPSSRVYEGAWLLRRAELLGGSNNE